MFLAPLVEPPIREPGKAARTTGPRCFLVNQTENLTTLATKDCVLRNPRERSADKTRNFPHRRDVTEFLGRSDGSGKEQLTVTDKCLPAGTEGEVTQKLFLGAEEDLIRHVHGIEAG